MNSCAFCLKQDVVVKLSVHVKDPSEVDHQYCFPTVAAAGGTLQTSQSVDCKNSGA